MSKKLLLFTPSIILFFLPYFYIVFFNNYPWYDLFSYPFYSYIDTSLLFFTFVLVVTFFQFKFIKRFILCLCFLFVGFFLSGIISAIMLFILLISSGFVLIGNFPNKLSLAKNFGVRILRLIYGFVIFLISANIPLRHGCPFGSGITEYLDTYFISVYVSIFAYILFDMIFFLINRNNINYLDWFSSNNLVPRMSLKKQHVSSNYMIITE